MHFDLMPYDFDKKVLAVYLEERTVLAGTVEKICFLIALFITSLYVIASILFTLKSSFYHRNLKILYICQQASWFEIETSKILVLLFQNEPAQIAIKEGRYTLENEDVPILKASAFLRYHYMAWFIGSCIIMIMERAFASYYIVDYEKKKRLWIAVILIIGNMFFAFVTAILILFGIMSMKEMIAALVVLFSIIVFGYAVLIKFNQNRYSLIEKDHRNTVYTLSIKYQLRENITMLNSLMRLALGIVAISCLLTLGLIVPTILQIPPQNIIFLHIFIDFAYHCNPLFLITLTLLIVPQNRQLLERYLSKHFNISRKKPKTEVIANEGDIYFQMFSKTVNDSKV